MAWRHDLRSDENGAITVDWAVLASAAVAMALATAGVLNAAIDGFSRQQARDLAIQNEAGRTLYAGGYTPGDADLLQVYLDGLGQISVDQLDALAGLANRLHTQGVSHERACDAAECGTARPIEDFLYAVDRTYVARALARPTHTRLDRAQINAAFAAMGLGEREIDALWGR